LENACITISNLGAFGVESFIPIVVPGQCSILGIGAITDTYCPDHNETIVRKKMNITLSVDHKVVNGAYAAQFLEYLKNLLEMPSQLFLMVANHSL
jgi:pyruvate dehydrogenase E2 component (dihydrolipoamide acetyltransferase)